MKIHSKIALLGGIMALVFAGGCTDDDDQPQPPSPPAPQLFQVGSAETDFGGMTVNVFSHDSLLYAEYTSLFVEVKDNASGDVLNEATVTVSPEMEMNMMPVPHVHGAPVENPAGTSSEEGMFPFQVVFTMPGETGWSLEINVYDPIGDREGTAVVPVGVGPPPLARVVNIAGEGGINLVMALVEPIDPKVGQNDFEVALYTKESDFDFPPAEDFTLTIDPQMPSMGHGSPNNVDPTHMGGGHYVGNVNFTMTGTWRVGVDIYDGSVPIDTTAGFEIVF